MKLVLSSLKAPSAAVEQWKGILGLMRAVRGGSHAAGELPVEIAEPQKTLVRNRPGGNSRNLHKIQDLDTVLCHDVPQEGDR